MHTCASGSWDMGLAIQDVGGRGRVPPSGPPDAMSRIAEGGALLGVPLHTRHKLNRLGKRCTESRRKGAGSKRAPDHTADLRRLQVPPPSRGVARRSKDTTGKPRLRLLDVIGAAKVWELHEALAGGTGAPDAAEPGPNDPPTRDGSAPLGLAGSGSDLEAKAEPTIDDAKARAHTETRPASDARRVRIWPALAPTRWRLHGGQDGGCGCFPHVSRRAAPTTSPQPRTKPAKHRRWRGPCTAATHGSPADRQHAPFNVPGTIKQDEALVLVRMVRGGVVKAQR